MVNAHIPPPGGAPPPHGPPQGRRGGIYLVAGVLVAIALAAGVLFYTPPAERTDQAAEPDRTMERTINPAPDEPRIPAIPREMPPAQTPIQPIPSPARE